VPVLLILVAVAILVGVVGVAIGRGGEMVEFAGDYPPLETDDLLTAADVALLRPPSALWGYNAAVTDQAFGRIAQVVTERDVEIAALRGQLAEIRGVPGADSADASDSPAPPAPAPPAPAPPAPAPPAPAPPAPAPPAPAPPAPAPPAPLAPRADEAAPAVADEAAPADAASADGGTGSGA
jgi:hypothetical protein